jgi:hypothetical protein
MKHRKHARYDVEYVGSFSGERISGQGVVIDLSSGGCRARSAVTFTKGDFLGVLIHIPGSEHPLFVNLAVVRWSSGQEFGTEFIRMTADDQQRLHELIRATDAARALRTDQGDSVTPH